MEEPTVLDYVKSKIFFWRGEKVPIPPLDAPDTLASSDAAFKEAPRSADESESVHQVDAVPREPVDFWPLVHLIVPLVLALLAQRFLEPPERSVTSGVILYMIAAAWVVWAGWGGAWQLPARQAVYHLNWQDTSFRPVSLAIAALLGGSAFIAFGDNLFTSINLMVWLISLGFFIHAFWQFSEPGENHWIEKWRSGWQSFLSDGIRFSPWTLLVIAAFALTAFFRFYMLDQVPGEMFSDHAEKLIDVSSVLNGEYSIFFPRNTGREAVQMYLTAAMARLFDTSTGHCDGMD